MANVYCLSNPDSVISRRLAEILAKIQSAQLIWIEPTQLIDAIQQKVIAQYEYAKGLQPRDLIILDASVRLSREELGQLVFWANSQKERVGTSVLAVGPEDTLLLSSSVDAMLPSVKLQSDDFSSQIVSWLFRAFHPGGNKLRDSESVLRLITARAVSIFVATMFQFCGEQESVKKKQLDFGSDLHTLAKIVMSDRGFHLELADQLASGLPPLLWVWLPEVLTSTTECHFFGLGTFAKVYQNHRLSISFQPEKSFAELQVPDMECSIKEMSQHTVEGIKLLFPHLPLSLYKFVQDKSNRLESTSILADLLMDVSQKLMTAPYGPSNEAVELKKYADLSQSWIGVFATAASFSAYLVTLTAISREIHEGMKFSVSGIGTFRLSGSGVDFVPFSELVELIDANPIASGFSIGS